MDLTSELLQSALIYTNPAQLREIDLSSQNLAPAPNSLTNLTAIGPFVQAINLANNALTLLTNLPLLPNLQSINLANNRIRAIQQPFHTFAPNIESINLANNEIDSLIDCLMFRGCAKLTCLALNGNPITQSKDQELYRSFMIHIVPSLRVLDWRPVKQTEIEEAKQLANTGAFNHILKQVTQQTNNQSNNQHDAQTSKQAIKARIAILVQSINQASNVEEINRIEQSIKQLEAQLAG